MEPQAASRGVQSAEARRVECDEGPGFEVAAQRAGTGLQGMSDRLAAVGGTLEIVSAAGKGTTVYGRVPLAPIVAAHAEDSGAEPNSAFIR